VDVSASLQTVSKVTTKNQLRCPIVDDRDISPPHAREVSEAFRDEWAAFTTGVAPPFYFLASRESFCGDALYTAVLFGGFALAEKLFPILREHDLRHAQSA
jgi:hypothetical protein